MSIKIAVLGASGQLGQEYQAMSHLYPWAEFIFFNRQELDVTQSSDFLKLKAITDLRYVINCAAYTAVDKAESEIEPATIANRDACQYLVDVLSDTNVRLIHFSTDYVYNHFDGFPLSEQQAVSPVNTYAETKYQGEKILRESKLPSMIIRTSWVISPYGHNFVKTMMRLGAEKEQLHVVGDQYGAPTYTADLVEATMLIISKTEDHPYLVSHWHDTYNYANEGVISWHTLATYIMALSGSKCIVHKISTSDYPTPARRPHWSVLSKHKLKTIYGIHVPHWHDALRRCMAKLR
jgi:dTDP-4-dehydrorhamnose reductase